MTQGVRRELWGQGAVRVTFIVKSREDIGFAYCAGALEE